MAVTDQQIETYWPRCTQLSYKYANAEEGVEMDDLVQEGLISVWQQLATGYEPNELIIQGRMSNWARSLRRQRRGDTAS